MATGGGGASGMRLDSNMQHVIPHQDHLRAFGNRSDVHDLKCTNHEHLRQGLRKQAEYLVCTQLSSLLARAPTDRRMSRHATTAVFYASHCLECLSHQYSIAIGLSGAATA